jgi:hypothetical protein
MDGNPQVIRLATMPPCDMRWDGSRRICHAVSPVGRILMTGLWQECVGPQGKKIASRQQNAVKA